LILLLGDIPKMDNVLRDANTRRIYVVDFAKTPAGPPNHLPKGLAAKAIEEISVAFSKNVLAPLCAGTKHAHAKSSFSNHCSKRHFA
jgi:hypothetical protein